jgi:hypothetical protein
MRATLRIFLFAAVGLWLYVNFEILGLATHYVHLVYILAFILQLALIFAGYLLAFPNGKHGGRKQGRR